MKTEPFLSGKWGWDLGEGDWKDGADENFLKFSYMLNGNVDGFVSSLPANPPNATAYYLTTDKTLNARVDGVWYKYPTPQGFVVTEKSTRDKYEFNGTTFTATLNAADKVKLNGVATGATVNSSDAALRDRATHTGQQAISTVTSLQTTLDAKAPLNSPVLTGTPTAPTVSEADNSTKLATTAWVKSQGYSTVTPTVSSVAGKTGDVVLTKADVGLGGVDNTSDLSKPVSTATQTALNTKAPLISPTFTGTVTLPSTTSIGSVSATELSYLGGVTSPIQAQINSITGVSGGYAPIDSPSFTGTVSGITKAMVGLGNVDNTSDLSKPVSTATQTALNTKQPTISGTGFVKASGTSISYDNSSYATTASPTFTGTVTLPSTTSVGSVTGTQLGYLVNTTYDIQTQLNGKASTAWAGNASNLTSGTIADARLPFGYSAASVVNNVVQRDGIGNSYFNLAVASGFNTNNISLSGNGTNALDLTSNASTVSRINLYTSDSVFRGGLFSDSTGNCGLLSSSGAVPIHADVSNNIGISSNLQVGGVVSGNGSGLNNLNASNISSGTLSQSRLPFNYSVANNAGYVAQRDGNGALVATSYYGNRAKLGGFEIYGNSEESLQIISATPNLTRVNLFDSELNFQGGLFSDAAVIGLLSNTGAVTLYITGSGNATFTNDLSVTGTTVATSFSGGGSGLTSLNATNISSGTLSDARLSSNVALVTNVVAKAAPSQKFQSLGSVSGGVSVSGASGIHVLATVTGNTTWTLPTPASDEAMAVTLELTNGGAYTMTWPASTRWAGGVAPTLTASGTDILVFTKAGTNNWRGYLSSKDSK